MSKRRFMVCARAQGMGRAVFPAGDSSGVAAEVEWCSDAETARRWAASNDELEAAWVVSCEQIDPINLAAALKADHPRLAVYLVSADKTGSVMSRVRAAGIDAVVAIADFPGHLQAQARPKPLATLSERTSSREADASAVNRAGFLLTIVSGGGGAGKSTVSALAALLGARRGLRVVLLDGDLQFGDAAELAGPCAQVAMEELAPSLELPASVADEPFVLVRAPRTLEQSEAVASRVGDVAELLVRHFDLVVVNTGGSWSEQHAVLLERSAATLFLIDQRASSVRACRHALDLCLRCGIATGSFLYAINRCTRHAPFTSIDVSSALNGAHVVELADGGAEVEELMGAGLASRLIEGGNPLSVSVGAVLDELLPRTEASAAAVETSLARIGLEGDKRAFSRRGKRKGRRARREIAAVAEG